MGQFRPVNDCFKKSENIRAQHNLFKDFKQERTDILKFYFYIWLQKNELKADYGKDENGDIGYGLEYIPKVITTCPLCNGTGRRVFKNCTPPIDEQCPACKERRL